MLENPNLSRKAAKGLAGFLIALWFFLFIPAWSLDFIEAWVYWSLFSISVIAITTYFLKRDPGLIESRLSAGPGAEKEPVQKVIQSFTSIFFIILLVVPGLDHRFGFSRAPMIGIVIGDLSWYSVFLSYSSPSGRIGLHPVSLKLCPARPSSRPGLTRSSGTRCTRVVSCFLYRHRWR